MLWNKIKIVALMVCLIAVAGTGSGWLAQGRSVTEELPPAAEPPTKKEGLPEAAPDLAAKIKRVHAQMDYLAEREEAEEAKSQQEAIEAQLQLAAARHALRLKEQEYELDRESEHGPLNEIEKTISDLEKQRRRIDENLDEKNEVGRRQLTQLKEELSKLNGKHREEKRRLLEREKERTQEIRSYRRKVFEAEYRIRRIEAVQARRREELATQRQALLARLQQLEDRDLHLQPADRLRDVERKLDSLQREIGELRRMLERQGNESQKKP